MALLTMAAIGAGIGGGMSAMSGGNVAQGAMLGGLTGGAGGALTGSALGAIGGGMLGGMLGGGTSTGAAPLTQIPLSTRGKQLEKNLHKAIKDDPFPENLVSKHIGSIKKYEQRRAKATRNMFAAASARPVRSGSAIKASVEEMRNRLRAGIEPDQIRGEEMAKHEQNRMINMINFMNTQKQTPVLRAGAQLASATQRRAAGAVKGAALGNMAQLLTLGMV